MEQLLLLKVVLIQFLIDFAEQYLNVLACSSRRVKDFVDWIQEQDFYDNTIPAMRSFGDHADERRHRDL